MRDSISSKAVITGSFSRQEAERIANALNNGPVRLKRIPTSIDAKMIATSPDGNRIAVANGNPTRVLRTDGTSRVAGDWKPAIDILDADSGQSVVSVHLSSSEEDAVIAATPRVSHFEVTAMEFSPDGKLLAIGTSIGQVKFFNVESGELVRAFNDQEAKLADEQTPENWDSLSRAIGSVATLAFSPDGKLLAVGGESFSDNSDIFDGVNRLGRKATGPGRLEIWDVASGQLEHDLVGHSHVDAVAFSHDPFANDPPYLVSAGRWTSEQANGTGVIVWNSQSGEKRTTINVDANSGIRTVDYSPNRNMIAIGARNYDKENDTYSTFVSVVFPLSGITEWTRKLPGNVSAMAFASDGKSLALQSGDQSIKILNVETGAEMFNIQAGSDRPSRFAEIAPLLEGRFAIAGVDVEGRDYVDIWSMGGDDSDSDSPIDPRVR